MNALESVSTACGFSEAMFLDVTKLLSGIRFIALQAVNKINTFLAMISTTANKLIFVSTERDRQTQREETQEMFFHP